MTTQAPTLKARSIHFLSSKLFLAAVTLLVATAGITVAAANRFAVVGVENGTQVTIRLQHKWGNGEWRTDVLRPGYKKWFWREYRSRESEQLGAVPRPVRLGPEPGPDVQHQLRAEEERVARARMGERSQVHLQVRRDQELHRPL